MKDRLLEDIRQVEGDINSVSGQIRVLEMKQVCSPFALIFKYQIFKAQVRNVAFSRDTFYLS